jgi:hypothetical protein
MFVWWLLVTALLGGPLLADLAAGGPHGLPAVDLRVAGALAAALTLAVAPAVWCARLFGVQAGKKLGASRALDEFGGRARPLLLATVLLFAGILLGLLDLARHLSGAGPQLVVQGTALGVLLFLARLLTVHGFPDAAAGSLGAACVVQAVVLASVPLGRLPGCGFLGRPVTDLVDRWGAGIPLTTACAGAAVVLLLHALGALSRASAHTVHAVTGA